MTLVWYSSTINTEEQNGVKQYSTSGFNCGFSALSPLSLYALWNSCWIPAVSFGSVTSSLVKSQDFRRHEQRKDFISWPLKLSMSFCPYVHTRCRWVDLEEFEWWSAVWGLQNSFSQAVWHNPWTSIFRLCNISKGLPKGNGCFCFVFLLLLVKFWLHL